MKKIFEGKLEFIEEKKTIEEYESCQVIDIAGQLQLKVENSTLSIERRLSVPGCFDPLKKPDAYALLLIFTFRGIPQQHLYHFDRAIFRLPHDL